MHKIYAYYCLLSALTIKDIMPLNIKGCVGNTVTFKCDNWNAFFNVKTNVKYFCHFPCKTDKDIIIKASFQKTQHYNSIEITNSAEGLFVTFFNPKKSDSNIYYCGAEKIGFDLFIKVNLTVTDDESSCPKTTPKTFAVTNSSRVATSSPDIVTDMSMPNIIQSTTTAITSPVIRDTGSVLYSIIALTVTTAILMVLLKLMRKMTKKQLNGRDVQEDVEYDPIRPEDQQTVRQSATISTAFFCEDPGSLYVNLSYNQGTKFAAKNQDYYSNSASSAAVSSKDACTEYRATDNQCELVYSVAQLPKVQISPSEQSGAESSQNDCMYSFAQLPQAS